LDEDGVTVRDPARILKSRKFVTEATQCAAVIIKSGVRIDPPHICDPCSRKETVHAHVPSVAASPPTIRVKTVDELEHPHGAVTLHLYVVLLPCLQIRRTTKIDKNRIIYCTIGIR